MESIEASGKSVEEAIQKALMRLGKRRDEVDIAVLQEPSRGLVGLGGREAIVRATLRVPQAQTTQTHPQPGKATGAVITPEMADAILGPDAEIPLPDNELYEDEEEFEDGEDEEEYLDEGEEEFEEEDEEFEEEEDENEPIPFVPLASTSSQSLSSLVAEAAETADASDEGRQTEMTEVEVPSREDIEITVDVLQHILRYMNIHATVQVRSTNPLTLNIHGINENLGLLIGRRGETLAALQLLVNLIVSHRTHHRMRIIVDAENYRQRREENLRSLALRVAQQVRSYRRSIALEAMPPHERRIVHIALSDSKDISTESIGEGDERRVVISLKRPGR